MSCVKSILGFDGSLERPNLVIHGNCTKIQRVPGCVLARVSPLLIFCSVQATARTSLTFSVEEKRLKYEKNLRKFG